MYSKWRWLNPNILTNIFYQILCSFDKYHEYDRQTKMLSRTARRSQNAVRWQVETLLLLQDCNVRNANQMICPVPIIDLPEELLRVNSSTSEDNSTVHTRRRRATAAEDIGGGWHWQLLGRLWNLVRTGSWHSEGYTPSHRLSRQKRTPVAYIKNKDVSMSLYLGFIMDKFQSLRNISKTKPNIQLELVPFDFKCAQSHATFDPAVDTLIKIKVII